MPVQVLARAIAQAFASRQYRPAAQVGQQVLRQRLGGDIALLGTLAQRLQADVVEVAGQFAAEPRGRVRARGFLGRARRRLRGAQRLAGERQPILRKSVPRERLRMVALAAGEEAKLIEARDALRAELDRLGGARALRPKREAKARA